jgi:hypothetical protein
MRIGSDAKFPQVCAGYSVEAPWAEVKEATSCTSAPDAPLRREP